MTAREKFQVHDRVRPTAELQERIQKSRSVIRDVVGTVRGFGAHPRFVRLQRDGFKSVESYHMDLWDVVKEGTE